MTLTAEGDAPKSEFESYCSLCFKTVYKTCIVIHLAMYINSFVELPFTNISPLTFSLVQETNDRLHVRIYEPGDKRWKVPERCVRYRAFPRSHKHRN